MSDSVQIIQKVEAEQRLLSQSSEGRTLKSSPSAASQQPWILNSMFCYLNSLRLLFHWSLSSIADSIWRMRSLVRGAPSTGET